MPPIKRTQKSVPTPPRRRLAGHGGPGQNPQQGPQTEGTRARGSVAGKAGATTGRPPGGAAGPRRRSLAKPLTYAALVVGLLAGAGGAVLATEPGIDVSNEAFVDRETTDEVLAAASTSVQRLVSIDHEELDAYHSSLGEYLTPNLVEELNQTWPALRDSYEESATTVEAQVQEAGLAHLDGDSAEVLLVQNVSMTRDGAAAGSTSGTYLVGLQQVDGVWKLSSIPDLPS